MAEAEVSERTIFNHFENIDAILLTSLGQHLADLVDVNAFPAQIELSQLPLACEDFLIQSLQRERSAEALDHFVNLAATFGSAEDIGESIGQEVFATVQSMSMALCQHVQELYLAEDDLRVVELALYLQNLLTGMLFGMWRYMYENPQLQENPSQYSNSEIRQNMMWGVTQVSAGRPKF